MPGMFGTYIGATPRSLWYIVEEYKRGRIVLAPHQRRFVWDARRIREWVATLVESTHHGQREASAATPLVTYHCTGQNDEYLNDGFQRVSATLVMLDQPHRYRLSPQAAHDIAEKFVCLVQRWEYPRHEQAMADFQMLNYSTPLTSYDFCKGLLFYSSTTGTNWMPTLDEYHQNVGAILASVAKPERVIEGSPKEVGWLRHDYVLLRNYVTRRRDLTTGYEPITARTPSFEAMRSGRVIEQQVCVALDGLGVAVARGTIGEMERFMAVEVERIGNIWIGSKGRQRPAMTVLRWLLMVAIWRRNTYIDVTVWHDFLTRVSRQEFRASMMDSAKQPGKTFSIGLGVNLLATICADIGSPLWDMGQQTLAAQHVA